MPLIVKSPTTLLSDTDFVTNVILSNSSVPKKSPDFKWLSRASFLVLIELGIIVAVAFKVLKSLISPSTATSN